MSLPLLRSTIRLDRHPAATRDMAPFGILGQQHFLVAGVLVAFPATPVSAARWTGSASGGQGSAVPHPARVAVRPQGNWPARPARRVARVASLPAADPLSQLRDRGRLPGGRCRASPWEVSSDNQDFRAT